MSRSIPSLSRGPLLALLIALALALLLPSSLAPAWAEVLPVKKTTLIAIPARFEVAAPPARVWKALCTTQGFSALTGFEIAAADRARSFTRTGDQVAGKAWTDAGRLVVTGYAVNRELRVTWEPENASYLCAKRVVLTAKGAGTVVEYLDRYTDDQANADATAAQVAAETKRHIAAFTALAAR